MSLGFWALGYGFAFGKGDHTRNGFEGLSSFFLIQTDTYDHWIFLWSFCAGNQINLIKISSNRFIAVATIASGSLAERTQMVSYIVYSIVVSIFIFPFAAHCKPLT